MTGESQNCFNNFKLTKCIKKNWLGYVWSPFRILNFLKVFPGYSSSRFRSVNRGIELVFWALKAICLPGSFSDFSERVSHLTPKSPWNDTRTTA